MMMMEAGLFIFGLLHFFSAFEESARKKLSAVTSLKDIAAEKVGKLGDDDHWIEEYPSRDLVKDDIIRIYVIRLFIMDM